MQSPDAQDSPTPSHLKHKLVLWAQSLIFSGLIALLIFGYYKLSTEVTLGRRFYSQLFANTGTLLIVFSFMMSGISYYLNILDTKLSYRKYLGLIGFYLTAIHVYIALDFASHNGAVAFSSVGRVIAFFLGCIAFTMFLEMAFLSNDFVLKALGSAPWRLMLRYTGYTALAIVVVHFFIHESEGWTDWFNTNLLSWPPTSAITLFFAIIAFLLRSSMVLSMRRKPQQDNVTE